MNCLEAQSKIIAYIDNNLSKEERRDFLIHIKSCSDCREELDIYYTMLEGTKRLDNNIPLPKDFSGELSEKIEEELMHGSKKRGFLKASLFLVGIFMLLLTVFGYSRFLVSVHEKEESIKKERQGDSYVSDTFKDYIFFPPGDEPETWINITAHDEEPLTYYEKLRQSAEFSNNLLKDED